jgi:hypothetical protein
MANRFYLFDWYSIVVLSKILSYSEGFGSGAPSEACSTLSPSSDGHGADPQSTPPPYEIVLARLPSENGKHSYTPGETYSIPCECSYLR